MRIGLFTDTYEPDINGVVSSIVTLQNALIKLGHEVFVVTNHNRLNIEQVGNVLFLPGIELKQLYGYTMSSFYSFKGKEFIKKMNLDIIHVHTEFGVGIFARMIAKHLNIPIVATYHTAYEDYTHYVNVINSDTVEKYSKKLVGKISKLYANAVDGIIAPSNKTQEMLLSYGIKTPIYEIPTGLNLSRFNDIDLNYVQNIRQTYNILPHEKLAIFVGRIAPEKNITMVIEAFKYVDDVKLMIVGGGPQLEELKAYANQLNIQDKVIFTDKKENRLIPQYYACADCFISASTSETQGMTYIEALAAKLVVFARRDEVVKNLIMENQNGYLFDDAVELAEKLSTHFKLSADVHLQQASYAKDSVKKYDDQEFAQKVITMYEDIMSEKIIIQNVRFEKDAIRLFTTNQEVLIDLDTYLTYHLAKDKVITRELWDKILTENQKHQAYAECLKLLNRKMCTEYEIKNFLAEKELNTDEITDIITKLHINQLINDHDYVETYLNQNKILLYSNQKIIRKLKEKGIPNHLLDFERDEKTIALHCLEKLLRTTKGKSTTALKEYVKQKLYQDGFTMESIIYALERVTISVDEAEEQRLLHQQYEKAKRLYQKYDGYEKERRIRLYLKTKGLRYEDLGEDHED